MACETKIETRETFAVQAMACENEIETREMFAHPVDLYCLGMCFWTDCPRSADVVTFVSHP